MFKIELFTIGLDKLRGQFKILSKQIIRRINLEKLVIIFIAITSYLLFTMGNTKAQNLENIFATPPQVAKTHVWWHWLNGNITRKGITKDLETMKRQGIGGATVFSNGFHGSIPHGPVNYLSQKWKNLFHYALKEADRLGMEIGMHNCDGWSVSGGPWITPRTSMKELVWSKCRVKGGKFIQKKLPTPPSCHNFYEDVAVLAYPSIDKVNSFQKQIKNVKIYSDTTTEDFLSRKNPTRPKLNKNNDRHELTDGNSKSWLLLKPFTDDRDGVIIDLTFNKPFKAERVALKFPVVHRLPFVPLKITIKKTSNKGKDYSTIKVFTIRKYNTPHLNKIFSFSETTSSRFRILLQPKQETDFFGLSECELLGKGDSPSWNPSIKGIETKAAANPKNYRLIQNKDYQTNNIVNKNNIINLTDHLNNGGKLNWKVPEGDWTIVRHGYTTTGVTIHPATEEGTGLECDKMDPEAADIVFDHVSKNLLKHIQPNYGKTWNHILVDSWEAMFQNWTEGFIKEFKNRRGYSLIPYLPIINGEVINNVDTTERFLHDFRQTIAELISENFYGHLHKRCKENGFELHAEVIYGGKYHPPADVTHLYGQVDVPMHEFWPVKGRRGDYSWRNYNRRATTNHASSAAHIYGKKVVKDEAFTVGAQCGDFSFVPSKLKHIGDWAYCRGTNKFTLHTSCHQPDNTKPGWTHRYNGINFHRNNTWWFYAKGWITYMNRLQAVLQKGQFVADVCYFEGVDIMENNSRSLTRLPRGYRADYSNREVLLNKMKVKNGRIVLPDGMTYHLLILPENQVSSLSVVKKLESLVRNGAVVIGPKPHKVNGLKDYKKRKHKLQNLADKIWGEIDGKTVLEHHYGQGKVIWGKKLDEILEQRNIPLDFSYESSNKHAYVNFIHRTLDDAEVYFIANPDSSVVKGIFKFRVKGKQPELWDPHTGKTSKLAVYRRENGLLHIPMTLDEFESKLLVFKEDEEEHITELKSNGTKIYPSTGNFDFPFDLTEIHIHNGAFTYQSFSPIELQWSTSGGNKGEYVVNEIPDPLAIRGPWQVNFDSEWGAPPSKEFDTLSSWSEHKKSGIKYYSGTAIYQNQFTVSEKMIKSDHRFYIDLGEVFYIAEVYINDKKAGTTWVNPHRLDITNLVKGRNNKLEIRVVNTFKNRLIGDTFLSKDEQLTKLYPSPQIWYTEESKLEKAGLLGPVKLNISKTQSQQ